MNRVRKLLHLLIPSLFALAAAARPAEACAGAVVPDAETAGISGKESDDTEMQAAGTADTTIVVDRIQITAIKQGPILRNEPVAATIIGSRLVERGHVDALKELTKTVPNLYIPDYGSRMTSSIYVRGLGARIDQPVVGLNIDNVPILNKNGFDTELADVERIEVLRGPQSTLYGRNTMGGVINIYTRSPLSHEGAHFTVEYGSGNTARLRASSCWRISPDLGVSVTGYYTRTDGFFENLHTGKRCDREQLGGGRWKVQWRNRKGLQIENALVFSVLDQGGYPYAYAGREPLIRDGEKVIRPGEIRYNDPSGYERTTVNDGFTIRYDTERLCVSSITSWQYTDDAMTLDQDFTPLSYFTLRQAVREHVVTEDLVFRSRDERPYRWLFGLFGFYRHSRMSAPVDFKQEGIADLILRNANANDPQYTYDAWDDDRLHLTSDFENPSAGAALYHESNYAVGRWRFTAGLRFDYEHVRLHYDSRTRTGYTATDRTDGTTAHYPLAIALRHTLKRDFIQLLPKFAILYAFDERHNLYLSASKGYKAGGFNTQMFSDILQQEMMRTMGFGSVYDTGKIVAYKPEHSWNYELGGHFSCLEGVVRGDFALFRIDCRDQQLTVFPEGTTTGRMMTNAGRTRSQGCEVSLQAFPRRNIQLDIAYGYTDARFRRYDTTEEDETGGRRPVSYRGNRIPYAPRHTLSAWAVWTVPTGVAWLGDLVLRAGVHGAGAMYWDEANSRKQPFYALFDASVRIEHARYSIDIWGRNLAETGYDLFYFKSVGNEFVQRGRPRTLGITLHVNL